MPLKTIPLIAVLLLLFVSVTVGQQHLPFGQGAKKSGTIHEPWLEPAVGFVPSINGLRVSFVSGNLLLNRFGGYLAVEKAFHKDYFTNIYGVTVTLSKHVYLWAGADLFTSRGIFHSRTGARKESGIGIMPWNNLVFNVGWSKTIKFTYTVGWKIPLE